MSERASIAGVLVLSLALNLWNLCFPLGYHGDEPKKVGFILSGEQDFHHPILILQLSRLANLPLGLTDQQRVAVLGRIVSAVAGAALILFCYLVARRIMPVAWALVAALSVAVSPIIAIHAHYLKEDVLYTACAFATMAAAARMIGGPFGRPGEKLGWGPIVVFGLATGLAMSTHYKSALLVALYPLLPLYAREARSWRFVRALFLALWLAAYVFLVVNYPLLDYPEVFLAGLEHESTHVVSGHTLRVHAVPEWFTFHLRNSVMPGMTWPAAVMGLAGLGWAVLTWRSRTWIERLLVGFAGLNYLAAELSPSKPEPDYARYILPTVPALLILGTGLVARLYERFAGLPARLCVGLIVATCVLVPLVDTVLLDFHLGQDTRAAADQWIAKSGGTAMREHYASADRDVVSLADLDLEQARRSGVDFLVASSFNYDRYYVGSRMPNQDEFIYQRFRQYERIFSYHFVEIRPAYKSFAFSNPTIRIIDIRHGDGD